MVTKKKLVRLWDMSDELMLVVEYPSGVVYENQVGGVVCWCGEIEGVLAPIGVSREDTERIQDLPYPAGIEGITDEIADTIDTVLGARSIRVDRDRMGDSWEAWVYVIVDSPARLPRKPPYQTGPDDVEADRYFGSVYGFGRTRGVLTWINSD